MVTHMNLEEGEVAVPVNDCEGYFITNRGRVWSAKSNKWLSVCKAREYHLVAFSQGGVKRTQSIHTLVGRHFLPEYKEGLFILHKDETLPFPDIHFATNLWVGTQQDNARDMVGKGRNRSTQSQETKRKISESMRGESNPNYGRKFSPQHRQRLREAALIREERKRKG